MLRGAVIIGSVVRGNTTEHNAFRRVLFGARIRIVGLASSEKNLLSTEKESSGIGFFFLTVEGGDGLNQIHNLKLLKTLNRTWEMFVPETFVRHIRSN